MFSNSDPDWIYPLAFPKQNIAETLPLEHDGLDLTEIGIEQRTESAKERHLAVIPGSNYILIQDIIYSIKRPFIHAPEIPRLLLPQRYRDKVIDRSVTDLLSTQHVASIPDEQTLLSREKYQMDFLGMDLVGPLALSTNNNRYNLTIVDHFSLWAESYPIPDKTNISEWDAFANHYLPRFACPATILTDNGWGFSGRGWEQYLLDLGIEHRRTTPYHPQSNGRTKNFNKYLKTLLSKACSNQVHVGR